MAVTIESVPEEYAPSDNPIVWTFSSDQTAQDNFVYVVDVYINDAIIKTELVFPDNGIYGRYDASAAASNACNTPDLLQSICTDAVNYCEVRITVTERYGTPPALEASAAAANIVAFKAKFNDDDFVDWTPDDYYYNTGAKWLTNFPTTNNPKIRAEDEQIRLMAINRGSNLTNIKVELFDANGVSIASDTTTYISAATTLIVICNFSPSVVIAALSITQANFDAASYYEVSANSGAGLDIYRIDIDTDCVYSTYKRIHFLSQWGTMEAFSFGLISRESAKVKSSTYRKQFGEWIGSGFIYAKTQGRDIDFAKVVSPSLMIESDWLDEDVQHWLVENLYSSVFVFEEVLSDGTLIQRKVSNGAYKKIVSDNDTLHKERLEVKLPTYTSMIL